MALVASPPPRLGAMSQFTKVIGVAGLAVALGLSVIVSPGASAATTDSRLVGSIADPGGSPNQRFGVYVATGGDTVVVGVPEQNSSQGAVEVFNRTASGAALVATLTVPTLPQYARLGLSVAISGDTIVAGAPGANGVDGGINGAGAIYLWQRPATGWTDAQPTTNLHQSYDPRVSPSGGYGDNLGFSVAISDGLIVGGAPGWRDQHTGQGAAFVFPAPTGPWPTSAVASTTLADPQSGDTDQLGVRVATSGGVVAAGSPDKDLSAVNSGAILIFESVDGVWSPRPAPKAYLDTTDAHVNQQLGGSSLAMEAGTVVAGDYFATVAGQSNAGAILVYERPSSGWASGTETTRLVASDAAALDYLGGSLDVRGDKIAVGAIQQGSTGISGQRDGAAYVFTRQAGTSWMSGVEASRAVAPTPSTTTGFGSSVAFSGQDLLVGEPQQTVGSHGYQGALDIFQNSQPQTISFTSAASSATVGGAPYTINGTGGGSGNPVVFTRNAVSTSGCSVSGSVISFGSPAGTCVVDANQAGGNGFLAAPPVQQKLGVMPAVLSVTPTHGAMNTTVTVTGAGFGGTTATSLGGVAANFTVQSDTQLNLTVPPAGLSGRIMVTANGQQGAGTFNFAIDPTLGDLTGLPLGPTSVVTSISVTDSFSAPTNTTSSAIFNWGDGSTTAGNITEASGVGSTSASHIFLTAGVYSVTIVISDSDGGSGTATSTSSVVAYDPSAGFVTGGGYINSPAGALIAQPNASGKANFGFVSRYQKGAITPSGNARFQFHDGNFDLRSTAYQWLVVTGQCRAQMKGTGVVNGTGSYSFLLFAVDGEQCNSGGQDTLRIKISDDATGATVYDNGTDQPITGDIQFHP